MRITIFLLMIPFIFLSSCAHRYPMEPNHEEVISTSNGKERPAWAMEKPRFIKRGQLYVSGMIEIDGSQSPARGLMAADLQARANLLGELKTRLHAQLQYATEGFNIDQQRLNNIITESIEVNALTGLYIDKRFYEKIAIKNAYFPRTKYICYSLATIPMKAFKEAVERNLRTGNSGKPLTKEFEKKVEKSWDRFFNNEDQTS